jgi:large subunit ribosomal protein L24
MKIKKGDNVKILIGKDKGKTGSVERVYPSRGQVLIAGINEYKRHMKSRAENQKSEIITITKPLPVSNIAMICPKCKKVTRVGSKIEKGKKIRICAKCKKEIN